ncbi:hypothetical protein VPH35_018744 [Triticum aestivum]
MQPYYHCLGGDRLSALPDTALVRVLSHLSSNEVARACALSRRWRNALAAVPVVDLVYPRTRRRRGVAGPIRALRLLTVDPPVGLLDQWIGVVIGSGVEEVDVELRCPYTSRRRLCPFWSEKSSADFDAVYGRSYNKNATAALPLPSGFGVGVFSASLQTLCLKRIMAANEVILQLLYGCPLLADLTLEDFAMVCCHNAQRVVLYTPCLCSLRYKGGLPPDTSFLLVAGYEGVAAVTMDICEDLSSKSPMEVAPLMGLVSWCRNHTYLHLALRPSMAYYCSEFLVLKGLLATEHAVRSVVVLLANARNLQVLSLFPPENCGIVEEAVDYDQMTNNLWRMHIPCLDHSLRRISIEKYNGNAFDRILAQFLVSRAAALEEFSVTLVAPLSPQKEEIAMEFRSWLRNPYAVVTCK